jgi:hypothetical protein
MVVDEEPAAPELEEGAELAPADLILQREAELQHIKQRIDAGQVAANNAAAAVTLERDVLEAVVKVRDSRSDLPLVHNAVVHPEHHCLPAHSINHLVDGTY